MTASPNVITAMVSQADFCRKSIWKVLCWVSGFPGTDCHLRGRTTTSPTQIYTVEAKDRQTIVMHTEERILGIPEDQLSHGEDASFVSFDGRRVPARLYLPAESLGFLGARPLVYYIHGGPQGQERQDFAWFSMPLIQYLTLRGFAFICVFPRPILCLLC
jgi:dipeptidyl aminopeptidase/acylaminoacyl peptidase